MTVNVTTTDLGIRALHLTTGEDILGHVYHDPESKVYLVERPISIQLTMNEQNQLSVMPLPLRPYLKKLEQLPVQDNHVVWVLTVVENMERLWQTVTSGIVMPGGPSNAPPIDKDFVEKLRNSVK